MCGFISRSVNELLKIKDELTKERDDKLSEISKVRVFDFLFFTVQVFILSFTQPNKIHKNYSVLIGWHKCSFQVIQCRRGLIQCSCNFVSLWKNLFVLVYSKFACQIMWSPILILRQSKISFVALSWEKKEWKQATLLHLETTKLFRVPFLIMAFFVLHSWGKNCQVQLQNNRKLNKTEKRLRWRLLRWVDLKQWIFTSQQFSVP